jgi:hypothetical protein
MLKRSGVTEGFLRAAWKQESIPPRVVRPPTQQGALRPPGELGNVVESVDSNPQPPRRVSANAHRVHPAVVQAQKRAIAAQERCQRAEHAAALKQQHSHSVIDPRNASLVTSLCYRGMEVVFCTVQSDEEETSTTICYGLCARTHLVFQTLTLASTAVVQALVSCPTTGLLVIAHADGEIQTYLPQDTDPSLASFGKYRWWNGPAVNPLVGGPHNRTQVSISHTYKILVAQKDILAVFDVTPVLENDGDVPSSVPLMEESPPCSADLLWMTRLPGKVVTAKLSGNGNSIALVLEQEDDQDGADGVHTFERDWDDGGNYDASSSIPFAQQRSSLHRTTSVGILYKPGPFLVHSEPVSRLEFRGLGHVSSQHTAGNWNEHDGNDLLLTISADEARIFSQKEWKLLVQWTTAAHTRVDWIRGITAFTLGDLETVKAAASKKAQQPDENVMETLGKRNHMNSISNHHAMPYSNAGAWISEITYKPVPSIRLSRLTYLRRGMDGPTPTLFESVSSCLPPGAVFAGVDVVAEAIWPAWNPWFLSETTHADSNETLRGSAMSFLGLSSGPTCVTGGSFGDSLLAGTQSPPCELRLTLSHPVNGRVTILEFRVYGDRASLDLETPRISRLSMADLFNSRPRISASLQHESSRLVAQANGRSVDVLWRRPGTGSLLPSIWMPEDVKRTGKLLASAAVFKDESLLPAPLILPLFALPNAISKQETISEVLWWDAYSGGGPYMLVVVTSGGSVVLFEVPPPWSFLETSTMTEDVSASSSVAEDAAASASVSEQQQSAVPEEYEVAITPDPDHGLGLRLESQVEGQCAIAGSYKKHPLNAEMLPAEKCGMITLGDELLSANGVPLEKTNFDEIIAAVREVGASCGPGNPMNLVFRRKTRLSRANSTISAELSRRGLPPEENKQLSRQASRRSSGQFSFDEDANTVYAFFRDAVPRPAVENSGTRFVLIPWSKTMLHQRTTFLAYLEGNKICVNMLSIAAGEEQGAKLMHVGSLGMDVPDGSLHSMSVFGCMDTSCYVALSDRDGGVTLGLLSLIEPKDSAPSVSLQCYSGFRLEHPEAMIRGYSSKLLAAMQVSSDFDRRKITVWSGVSHPGSALNDGSEMSDEFTSFELTLEDAESGNRVVDFCFMPSGYMDALPTLVVFTLKGASLYLKHGGTVEWTPAVRILYGGISNSDPTGCQTESGIFPGVDHMKLFDAYPHLASGIFSVYSSRDEASFLRSDWHPESLLAYICTDESGANHALRNEVRRTFLWLRSEGADIPEDRLGRPLVCAPMSELYAEAGTVEEPEAGSTNDNSLLFTHHRSKSDEELVQMLEFIHEQYADEKKSSQKSASGNGKKIIQDGNISPNATSKLPNALSSLSKEDTQLLWSVGELITSPPDFRSLDVSGQLFLFAASLLRKVDSTVDKQTTQERPAFYSPFSMGIQRTNSTIQTEQETIQIASAGCFAALVSNDQDTLLDRCRQPGEKFDWNRVRELRVAFWLRSDVALAKIAEEAGQAIFRKNRDIMDCALFFIIARKMRTLRNLAATDQSESGRKFFKFLTSYDFSSERGRLAAEKNAFSLLRKCKYRVASAFFLLGNPPALKAAIETIVANLHDADLAFLVMRLMTSRDIKNDSQSSSGGIFGGGGGYAVGGVQENVGCRADKSVFEDWKPDLEITANNLLIDRIMPMTSDDTVMTATSLLWLNKRDEAAWFLSGTMKLSYEKNNQYIVSSNDSAIAAFGVPTNPGGWNGYSSSKKHPMDKANKFINFVSGPVLLKSLGSASRPLFAAALSVCTALTSRGIELPAMRSLQVFSDLSSPEDTTLSDRVQETPGLRNRKLRTPSGDGTAANPSEMQSSIFDGFDAPKPQRPKPGNSSDEMQSSIFDAFDAPIPQPSKQQAATNSSGDMQSSIFDGFDAPKPQPPKPGNTSGEMQSSIFDGFDAPKPQPPKPGNTSGEMQSSIFDGFDAPKPQPPKPGNTSGEMQSSIFDGFDAPKPQPPKPGNTSGEMQSSIFDGFDAPKPQPSKPGNTSGEMQSSIFDAFDATIPQPPKPGNTSGETLSRFTAVHEQFSQSSSKFQEIEKNFTFSIQHLKTPALWSEWKAELLAEAAARRLVREVSRILAGYHGDPPELFMEDFYDRDLLVPPGVSGVLQIPSDGPALVGSVQDVLDRLTGYSRLDPELVVRHAIRLLGETHIHRLLFAVVLHASTGRGDLAENMLRDAARGLIQCCHAFAFSQDGIKYSRFTRSHASSQFVRREAARLSWQLESCLWLHRGDSLPLSGVAIREAICAVRLGLLIASWNRTFECIQGLLHTLPDCPIDDDAGRHLWTSLEVKKSEQRDVQPKKATSGGWEFLVDCKRSQSTEMLRDRPTGCFIIRPHSQDHGVFTLSFKTNLVPTDADKSTGERTPDTSGDELSDVESSKQSSRQTTRPVKKSDVVQHAIVRLSDSGFRCGSFGPFASLISLLEAVSASLPFKLRFDKPPVDHIIQDEGSQTSPNAVLLRKLALRRADSVASNPPMAVDPPARKAIETMNGQPSPNKSPSHESKNSFGPFFELLILSLLCRQLSGVVSVMYNDTQNVDVSERDSTDEEKDEVVEVISEDIGSVMDENQLHERDRILGPFLTWYRSMEVRVVSDLAPELASVVSVLPKSTVDVTESAEAIEVAAFEEEGKNNNGGDAILRRLIQHGSGVEFSTLRLVDGGECTVVVLFRRKEALSWLVANGLEQSQQSAEIRLQEMEDKRFIEAVDLSRLPLKQKGAASEDEGVTYRFVDPWEVEALQSREGETRGASLGRCRFLGFSLGKVALASEAAIRSLGGLPLLELWTSVKGDVTLTKALASVHPPWDRAAGGDLTIAGGNAAESSPYLNSIRQHLYRNALFRRLDLPQRFVALVQVELLDLKNLTSPDGSLSLNVYALLRLKRAGSVALLTNKARTLDSAATHPVKLSKSSGPNAPASWGSVVRFRFPLPEDISVDGTSKDKDRESLFRGPPSFLQVSVYERKLLADHSLGAADVSMDGLWAGGQLEEWVPLRSDKNGITWFTRVRLTLRFELMCLSESKDLAPSVGLQRIAELSRAGGVAHEDVAQRSMSSPDLLSYFESMVY